VFSIGAISVHQFAAMSALLDKIPDVDIDGHGRFKYILIKVQDEANEADKQIVRGYARAQWHCEFVNYLFLFVSMIMVRYIASEY
jgi:hypothetical protein